MGGGGGGARAKALAGRRRRHGAARTAELPLRLEYRDAAELKENPRKWRRHPPGQVSAVRDLIAEVGWAGAALYNEITCRLIDGHCRRDLAIADGVKIPVLIGRWSEEQERKILAALDPITGMAEADELALSALLAEVETESESLRALFATLAPAPTIDDGSDPDDDIPDRPRRPTTKRGDVWLLGDHRLLCGDATVLADVTAVLEGKPAGLAFVDPPYNVDYEGKTAAALKIQNDKMPAVQFATFLAAAFRALYEVCTKGTPIYVCHADTEGLVFRQQFAAAGWVLKQCLVWVKNVMVLGRQDYQWRHEPILYGWKPGAAHRWYGGRKNTTVIEPSTAVAVERENGAVRLTFANGVHSLVLRVPKFEVVHQAGDDAETVWRFNKPLRSADHPTMKPVALPQRAIALSSRQGDVVLDTFGGGGGHPAGLRARGAALPHGRDRSGLLRRGRRALAAADRQACSAARRQRNQGSHAIAAAVEA